MSAMFEARLPFDDPDVEGARAETRAPTTTAVADLEIPDRAARTFAVDPRENVVLEASAGTGKTRVLVERYVRMLVAGVEPEQILAITFTRKAAAEMRQRILARLHESSRTGELTQSRWRELKGRFGDIAISTIDAFCLSLLREFPLEADVDPAFELADDTELARLVDESLDHALRVCRALAKEDDDVALVFAQLGERRLRVGLAALLDRRLVAPETLRRYLAAGPRDLAIDRVCAGASANLCDALSGVDGGLAAFLACGPLLHPDFAMLAADIVRLCEAGRPNSFRFDSRADQAAFRVVVDRLRGYFLTQAGPPRGERFSGTRFKGEHCRSDADWKRHRERAAAIAPQVASAVKAFRRDLNVVLSRGVWRMFAVVVSQYQRTLAGHALLDFSGVLQKAIALLQQMDEFARSRYRLESRYRHVLVDEFQDTSRAQWELVEQLVRSWSEGEGASADALSPSIFIVGDRKQSIYGFRDAEVGLLEEAADFIHALRSGRSPRRAISTSFRAAPEILAFVNDLFGSIELASRPDAFTYGETDRFPVRPPDAGSIPHVGVIAGATVRDSADRVAHEVARLIDGRTMVRDKETGVRRAVKPADIAILFRSRDSHREFEEALERRGLATYVYKGLGFFDADEIQDAVALLRFLAEPTSDIRAAAFLRSRLVRLSDAAIEQLAPRLADAIADAAMPAGTSSAALTPLGNEDRRALVMIAKDVARWLTRVDRVTPAELLDSVLEETAYAYETRGRRHRQARENLKKLGAMIRRIQNRGYATIGRIADHLDRLAVGDESNATIDALDSVSLMTVHAAKGLEFPVVFVVNCGRGTGGIRAPIRVATMPGGEPAVAVADFQSEADEDALARDREETKRLLYVALTRARDRLYLSASVENATVRMNRGSLGEVLPASFRAVFAAAASVEIATESVWSSGSGVHRLLLPAPL